MLSPILRRFFSVLFFAGFFSFLIACSGPVILTQTYKKQVLPPDKKAQTQHKIPGTQKPYKIKGKSYFPLPSSEGYSERGIASWYGRPFHGRKTSNGETYDMHSLTAAHKTLPMNTYLLVKNIDNNKELIVRINDRGPFVKGRIIDLSLAGAKRLDMASQGTAMVQLVALGETVTSVERQGQVQHFLPHQDFDTGDFFIQIGSFQDTNNAERLAQKVTAWGSEVTIQPFNHAGQKFFRVQVKAGRSLKTARRQERIFIEAGFPDAFVIAR